jgi:hypothetical protein
MNYKPTLIKDRLPNLEGEKYGPVNESTYIQLYNDGYIADEFGLIKTKKQKTKKAKEDDDNNE